VGTTEGSHSSGYLEQRFRPSWPRNSPSAVALRPFPPLARRPGPLPPDAVESDELLRRLPPHPALPDIVQVAGDRPRYLPPAPGPGPSLGCDDDDDDDDVWCGSIKFLSQKNAVVLTLIKPSASESKPRQ